MTFPVGIFPLKYFREIFPFVKNWIEFYSFHSITNYIYQNILAIDFIRLIQQSYFPRGVFFSTWGNFERKSPCFFFFFFFFFFFMFLNKIQNLFLPLIKLSLDCVSSYYVLLNVCHTILNNFTYPMGVKAHRVFSPSGKNPAVNRKL